MSDGSEDAFQIRQRLCAIISHMSYHLTMGKWRYHFERVLVKKTLNSREFPGNQNLEKTVGESWTCIL